MNPIKSHSSIILAILGMLCVLGCSAYDDFSNTKQPAGHRIQEALDRLSYQMHNLQSEVSRLTTRMDFMDRKQEEIKREQITLTRTVQNSEATIGNLKQGYEKLSKTDAIWRNNFRIVNNVLVILKKKFYIISDQIRFGQ